MNFDLVEFKQQMTDILKGQGITINKAIVQIVSDRTWRFDLESKNGFRLSREFYPSWIDNNYLECHHSLFQLPKEAQGKGISKEVFNILYDQYQKIGVRYVSAFANIDVGGYCWAKYGFYATTQDQALSVCGTNREARRFITGWYKTKGVPSDTPFPMYMLAEIYGKSLLLDTGWDGIMDLQDDFQRGIWEKYLRY